MLESRHFTIRTTADGVPTTRPSTFFATPDFLSPPFEKTNGGLDHNYWFGEPYGFWGGTRWTQRGGRICAQCHSPTLTTSYQFVAEHAPGRFRVEVIDASPQGFSHGHSNNLTLQHVQLLGMCWRNPSSGSEHKIFSL